MKAYIAAHRDLVPAKRRLVDPRGSRGKRFRTAPGEAYQMDWGFVAVERPGGERARMACFAMVCHHCGSAHVEFFPNARQENLLIEMLNAFSALGVPATVLTDNMRSVVLALDHGRLEGRAAELRHAELDLAGTGDELPRVVVAASVGLPAGRPLVALGADERRGPLVEQGVERFPDGLPH